MLDMEPPWIATDSPDRQVLSMWLLLPPHLEPVAVAHLSTLRTTCRSSFVWFDRQAIFHRELIRSMVATIPTDIDPFGELVHGISPG